MIFWERGEEFSEEHRGLFCVLSVSFLFPFLAAQDVWFSKLMYYYEPMKRLGVTVR